MLIESMNLLYRVKDVCRDIREDIDTYLYRQKDVNVPDEDMAYIRRVYDAVCKVMDLL